MIGWRIASAVVGTLLVISAGALAANAQTTQEVPAPHAQISQLATADPQGGGNSTY